MYRVAKTHRMPSVAGHFSKKEPLILGLFCRKWPMKIRHLMTLRHPVLQSWLSRSGVLQSWLLRISTSTLALLVVQNGSFAKEPYKKDDILQKRPIFQRSLPIVATPYTTELNCENSYQYVGVARCSTQELCTMRMDLWIQFLLDDDERRDGQGRKGHPYIHTHTHAHTLTHTCTRTHDEN